MQKGGLFLTVNLVSDLGENQLVAFCQCHVLQRVGSYNLRLCRVGQQQDEWQNQYFNDW